MKELLGDPNHLALNLKGYIDALPTCGRSWSGMLAVYAAESSAPSVAAATMSAGVLAIAPSSIGEAVVTVTATDPAGLSATQTAQIVVEASRAERERVLQGALSTFGRALGAEAVVVVGRLGLESGGGLGRAHLQLGGRALDCNDRMRLARSASGLLGLQVALPNMGGPGAPQIGNLDPAMLLFGAANMIPATGGPASAGGPATFGAPGIVPAGAGITVSGGDYQGQREPVAGEPGAGSAKLLSANPLSRNDVLERSSFQMSFGGAQGDGSRRFAQDPAARSGWTVWGWTGVGGFDGRPGDGLQLTGGRARSAHLGLDYRFASGLLVGLAGARTSFETGFESTLNGAGSVDAGLTSVHPYVHWSPSDGLGLWALAGVGFGDATLEETAGGRFDADIGMLMGALGARRELAGGFALKADAFSVRIRSDDAAGLAGVTARAHRVRLAPELAATWTLGAEASLRTRLELGARYDGGDAETGLGAEAGAEAAFDHAPTGLSVGLRGRALLAHQVGDLREWGAGFSLRFQPGGSAANGLSLSVEPAWGQAAAGAGTLWSRGTDAFGPAVARPAQLAAPKPHSASVAVHPAPSAPPASVAVHSGGQPAATQSAPSGWTPGRVAMEFGYGLALDNGAAVTPFGRWSHVAGAGRRLHVGTRFSLFGAPSAETAPAAAAGPRLFLQLFGEHATSPLHPSQRRIGLAGAVQLR